MFCESSMVFIINVRSEQVAHMCRKTFEPFDVTKCLHQIEIPDLHVHTYFETRIRIWPLNQKKKRIRPTQPDPDPT